LNDALHLNIKVQNKAVATLDDHYKLMSDASEKMLAGIGATASAILNLTNLNKSFSISDIAKNLNLPPSTVTRVIKQIEDRRDL